MEIIRQSRGAAKEYAPLVLDLYENKNGNVKPVKNALDKLAKDAAHLKAENDQREILLDHKKDPYPDEKINLNITVDVIKILIENKLNFSILTEEAENAVKYLRHLEGYNKARFGTKLLFNENGNSLNPEEPPLLDRIELLKLANKLGIKTWVDLDPDIDTNQASDIIKDLHPYVNHWKVGNGNNGKSNVDGSKFHADVAALLDSVGADYYPKKSPSDIKESKKKIKPKTVSTARNGISKEVEGTGPWTEGVIPTRKGNRSILVIAPHGHSSDDTGTYQLARQLADQLDCYAVVNKKYRKRENLKPNDKYEEKYLVDLYLWPEIEKSQCAMKDFFGPIEKFKDQILNKNGSLLLLHIHGIGDNIEKVANLISEFKHRAEDLHLLIGYGQHRTKKTEKKRITADLTHLVEPLIASFQKQRLNAAEAPTKSIMVKKGKKTKKRWYCGNDPDRLNQKLCKPKNKARSLQLEFKSGGLRDNAENINKTAIKLANTVKAVWKMDMPAENQNLPDTASPKANLAEIYANLMARVSKGFESTMLDAGKYLIETFYGGDYKNAKKDEKRQSLTSLNQYILEMREKNPDAPKKSWIYNAVNLVIEYETIKAHSEELFHTYGILPLSHKVLLFPVKDMSTKQELIEYAGEHQSTVIEFKRHIAELKSNESRKGESGPSLLKIIANPEKIFAKEMTKLISPKALKQLPSGTLEKLQSKAKDSVVRIEANIKTEKSHIERYQKLIKAISSTTQRDSKGHSLVQSPKKKA